MKWLNNLFKLSVLIVLVVISIPMFWCINYHRLSEVVATYGVLIGEALLVFVAVYFVNVDNYLIAFEVLIGNIVLLFNNGVCNIRRKEGRSK